MPRAFEYGALLRLAVALRLGNRQLWDSHDEPVVPEPHLLTRSVITRSVTSDDEKSQLANGSGKPEREGTASWEFSSRRWSIPATEDDLFSGDEVENGVDRRRGEGAR